MAVSHGKNAAVWLNAFDFSGYATSATLSIDIDTVDVTTFADGAHTFVEGDYGFTFDIETLFDTTDAGWDDTSFAACVTNGGLQYVLFAPTGLTQGTEPVYELVCRWTSRPLVVSVGDAVRISGSMVGSGSGSLSRGYVLQNETLTATGTETGYNMGAVAASTKISVATYRAVNVGGGEDYVLALEESSDNAAGDPYAAVAALASGTISADGVTRVTTTGALEAWRRINCTNAPTSVTSLVTHTIAPNT